MIRERVPEVVFRCVCCYNLYLSKLRCVSPEIKKILNYPVAIVMGE